MLSPRYCSLLALVALVSACVQASTIDYVAANKQDLLNSKITVSGEAVTGNARCTLMACTAENPCCNRCSSSLLLKGSKSSLEVSGSFQGREVSCSGNSCSQECYPMQEGKNYIATGTLKESFGQFYIELESFSEAT